MAGNIIPAIATTNAIIAGLAVMELFKVLQGRWSECQMTYLNRKPNAQGKLLVRCILDKPNPKCYVCCPKPEISIKVNVKTFTVQNLETKILKAQLNMEMPDVEIDDGKGTILISSEEDETTENNEKRLNEFGIQMGTRLKCDDFSQNYTIVINIIDCELQQSDGQDFEIVGDVPSLESKHNEDLQSHKQDKPNGTEVSNAGLSNFDVDSEDDLLVIYDYPLDEPCLKRKINDDTEVTTGPNKKQRISDKSSQDVILL